MMSKQGRATMTSLILAILMVLVIFYGTFNYVSTNYLSSNVTIPLNYTNSYNDLQVAEGNLNTSVENIKTAAQNIAEADANVFLIGWNGLTGIASTIRLFLSIIDIGISVFNAILPGLSFLPLWIKLLIEMAILITIVLVIIGAFKGETKT